MPQPPMTPSAIADPNQFEGIVDMQRRSDGLVMLQKVIDFSHPKAPVAFDVLTRHRARGQVPYIPFFVTDQEAYNLHRGA